LLMVEERPFEGREKCLSLEIGLQPWLRGCMAYTHLCHVSK